MSQFTIPPGRDLIRVRLEIQDRGMLTAMAELESRLRREYRTLEAMVRLYCRDHHSGASSPPCADCQEFLGYAEKRLLKCPYGQEKPTCARCPVHCYKRVQREQARIVMRYAGPRMIWRHPWLSLLHLLDKFRQVEHPMEIRRRRNASARRFED